jgi:hypothetical protein
MTKVAQLHDGTTLEFPDDMPDDQMDAQVQQHLATRPKVAQMHDGRTLEFPHDTPDHHIDGAIREQLGLPPMLDPAFEQHAFMQGVEALSAMAKVLAEIAAGVEQAVAQQQQLAEAVNKHLEIAAADSAIRKELIVAVQGVIESNTRNAEATLHLAQVQSAPKMFITDSRGLPVGLQPKLTH